MKSRDLSIIGLRLLAIYFVLMSFRQMLQFVSWESTYSTPNPPPAGALWGLAASFTLMLLIGVLMFVFADSIGNWLVPRRETEEQGITSEEFRAILFSGVGLLIIGLSIERTFVMAAEVLQTSLGSEKLYALQHTQSAWFNMIGSLLETLFGVVLFLGVKGVKKLWLSLRSWPEPKENIEE